MPSSRPALGSVALGTALVVLGVAGVGHRLLAGRIDAMMNEYLRPKKPMATLPHQIDTWKGEDVEMDEQTRKIAAEDDFINRQYVDAGGGRAASVYVGYIGRPRSLLAHQPEVCYRTHGFKQVSRETRELVLSGDRSIPILMYEFAAPSMGVPPQLVLATFVVNGRWVNDTTAIKSYNARGPGLFSAQLAYVARVQISMDATGDRAADMAALSSFSAQLIEKIRELLPE